MKIQVRARHCIVVLMTLVCQGIAAAAVPLLRDDVDFVRMAPTADAKSLAKMVVAEHNLEGIVVFELTGDYGRDFPAARAEVAQRYLSSYQDNRDLLFVFSAFEFNTGDASAFANVIKNDVQGLGVPLFDSSSAFGSASGRLQNYIDMAALSRWEFNPSSANYGTTLNVAAHEVMHRWVAHPQYLRNGQPSSDLLGSGDAHWSFFLDTDASVMYGADWRQGQDGTFESVDIRHRLSALDLYLAGWYAASEVPAMTLIRNGVGAIAQDLPVLGFRTPGNSESIEIDQIIAANGARIPDVMQSPKQLTAGLVLLVRPGQSINEQAIFDLQRFARDFEARFAAMTRGRASFSIRNEPAQIAPVGAPTSVTGGALCTTCNLDLAQARVWLAAQQHAGDGSFTDKGLNRLHASAAVLRAMRRTTIGSTGQADAVAAWLAAFGSRQFDVLAWKNSAGVVPESEAELAFAEVRHQSLLSGPQGLGATWSPSIWDAVTLVSSAEFYDLQPAQRDNYLQALRQLQNADGGFGVSPGGVSHVAATAWTLNELAPRTEPIAQQIAGDAVAWLLTQRNPDGSYGVGADAVLPTAWAIAGLVRRGAGADVSASIAFLRSRQSQATGDWNGSVFTTAEVVRVLEQINKANLSFDAPASASPAAPIAGDLVRIRTRVRNDGLALLAARLTWFLGDPDAGGTPIGSDIELGALGAGQSLAVELDWNTTGLTGEQQIWAVLDRANSIDELNETDNRQSLTVFVTELPNAPDAALVRANIVVTPAAVNAYPVSIAIAGTVENLGGAGLTAVPVVLYTVRNGIRAERARVLVDIAAQSSASLQLGFTLERGEPLDLLLVADPDNAFAEIRETNNELSFQLSSSAGVDLAIAANDLVLLTEPALAGHPVRLRVTAHNHGASASPNFVLSAAIRRGAQSYPLGDLTLQLDAGASTERELVWNNPVLGAAILEVSLDPAAVISETDRANNMATLAFEVIDADAPNLIVEAQSIQLTPSPLDQAQPANLQVRLRNAGAAFTGPWTVAISTGGETGARTELARSVIAEGLAATATTDLSIALPPLPTAGLRYFFVVADPDNLLVELSENDNTAFAQGMVRSIPDASVTVAGISLSPPNLVPGALAHAVVTVHNFGQQPLIGLQVRLLDGAPPQGSAVTADQVAADIPGGGTAQLSFNWTYAAGSGPRSLSAQLDPDNLISEIREDNNLAVLSLQELGDHYATEPYISPNDDGVKESTQIVFRNLASTPALIDVRDIADRMVRSYPPEQFVSGNGIAVLWDGRDNEGRVVGDGRYRVQAVSADASVLAEVAVIVDTNRSSILEAVGTGLERFTILSERYAPWAMALPPAAYADQDVILLKDPLNLATADPLDRLSGIYRFDVLLGTLDPVLDGSWLIAQGTSPQISLMHWAEGGDYLVILVKASGQDSLWRIRVDGRNVATRLAGPMPQMYSPVIQDAGPQHVVVWNSNAPNSSARRYRLDVPGEVLLQAGDAWGGLLEVLEDGLLVGDGRSLLYFISFNPAQPVNTILSAPGNGYIFHRGAQGVLLHRVIGAQESIIWRSLRGSETQVVMQEQIPDFALQNRWCVLGHEQVEWFGGESLLHNYARRNVMLFSVDDRNARTLSLPVVDRVGAYASSALVHDPEYSFQASFLGAQRAQPCFNDVGIQRGATGEKSTEAVSEIGKLGAGLNPGGMTGTAPAVSLAYDTEMVRILNHYSQSEVDVSGAGSVFLVERATGSVTRLRSSSFWPLLDPRDQSTFPPTSDYGYAYFQGGPQDPVDGVPAALLAVGDPLLLLGDGSGITRVPPYGGPAGHRVFLSGGYFTGASFPRATSLQAAWDSERHLLGSEPGSADQVWIYSSLANQPTKLRARGTSTGIDLLGIAADKNFQQFDLEWASPDQPEQWHAVGPTVAEPVMDGSLMSWTPPNAGQYLLRLRTEDKAGNRSQATTRAMSPSGSDIDNVRLASRYVSPNSDGIRDALSVSLQALRPTTLRFEIRNAQGAALVSESVQVFTEIGGAPYNWSWDGRLSSGQIAPDGVYRIAINSWFQSSFTIDSTPPVLQISRTPGRADGKVARITASTVSMGLKWSSTEQNSLTLELQRSTRAQPDSWMSLEDTLPAMGQRSLTKSDDGNYRLVAEDRAGNRSVSPLVGFVPADIALVGRWVWEGTEPTATWGCDAIANRGAGCVWGALGYSGSAAHSIEADASIALDYYLAPGTPDSELLLRYQVSRFGAGAPVTDGPWQSLTIDAADRNVSELRLRALAPGLPLGSQIAIQAGTRLGNGSILYSESAAFEYIGISAPRAYFMGLTCSPSDVETGLPAPAIPGSWVCVEEGLPGLVSAPTLTVVGLDGNVRAVQVPVRITDGVVLFDIPDSNCLQLIARATSASGRQYQSRSSCTANPPTVLELLRVFPEIEEACDVTPRHLMRYQAAFVPLDGRSITQVRGDILFSDGSRRQVFNRVDPPPITVECANNPVCVAERLITGTFDASDLPDTRYDFQFELTYSDGTLASRLRRFHVDRTPALLDIRTPRAGRRECVAHDVLLDVNRNRMRFPVDARITDASGVSAQLRFAPIPPQQLPAQWPSIARGSWALYPRPLQYEDALIDTGAQLRPTSEVSYPLQLDIAPGQVLALGPMQGQVQAQFLALNWSGAPQCRVIEFYADLDVTLETLLDASTVRTNDSDRLPVINPQGAEQHRSLRLSMRVNEPVQARVELWRETTGGSAEDAVFVSQILPPADYVPGVHSFNWDGTDGLGGLVPDGTYSVRIYATDDCGYEAIGGSAVLVDTAAPEIVFLAPDEGATIDELLVAIEGTAIDASGGAFDLTVESASSIPLLSGPIRRDSLPTGDFATSWNRGVIGGPVILRVTATDLVGNTGVTVRTIQLQARLAQLFDDASVLPGLFSPNADGTLDRVDIRYALATSAEVSIRVLRGDGSLLTVLQNAEPKPSGNHYRQWLGEGLPPTAADGAYLIELLAIDPSDPLRQERLRLAVNVDVSAPQLSVLSPTEAYVRGDGALRLRVDEVHHQTATWQLGAHQGAVSGPGEWSLIELSSVEEGSHLLVVNATDRVGNSARLEHPLTLDRTPPASIIANPAEAAVLGGAANEAAVIGTAADLNFERFRLSISSAGSPGTETLLTESTTAVSAGQLHNLSLAQPDGAYLLTLRVDDKAGNEASVARAIHIDHTAPVAALTEPANNAYVSARFRVAGTAQDAHLAEYRLRLATPDQASLGLWSDVLIQHASVVDGELGIVDLQVPDGDSLLELVATDKVQQRSTLRIRIRLDSTPPPTPISLVGHRQGDADVALAWQHSVPADLAGYRVYRDGSAITPSLVQGQAYTDANVPGGSLRYEVSALDHAGNESARSNAVVIDVDRTPPVVDLISPLDQSLVSSVIDILGTAFSGADFDRLRLSLVDPGSGSVIATLSTSSRPVQSASLASWDTRSLAEGAVVQLLLEAWDRSGNRASDSAQVTIDNLAPAAPSGLVAVDSNGDGQINWDANVESDLLGYILLRNGSPVNAGSTFPNDPRVLALVANSYLDPALVDGHHTWIVYAIDRAGNLSPPSAPTALDIARRPPDIRIAEPVALFRFGESVGILAVSEDLDLAEVWFDYRVVGGSDWTAIGPALTSSPYAVTWTPGALPLGEYDLRAQARDQSGLDDPSPAIVRVRYADVVAPAPVTGVTAHADGGDVQLSWAASTAVDLAGYRVERSGYPDGSFENIAVTASATTTHVDTGRSDGVYYYRVTALDDSDNAAPPSVVDNAKVFTISVRDPYSPTSAMSVALNGATPIAGSLRVERSVGGPWTSVIDTSVDVGDFELASVPLAAGENQLRLRVTDADGNISRAAETWISSGGAPSVPTGLVARVIEHDVSLNWNANPESNIAGYRLFRRDYAVLLDAEISDLIASSSYNDAPSAAVDGDPETAWLANTDFYDDEPPGIWLELDSGTPRQISAVRLQWLPGRTPLAFDILAYSGRTWARIASVDEVEVEQTVRLAQAYRTSQLRIVPTRARYGYSIALAEVELTEQPLLVGTDFTEQLIDGRYDYTISAVNTLGFESARSAAVIADVGDAEPPEPVVLSGQLLAQDAQLSWTTSASTDVARYQLLRNGVHLAYVAAPTTSYVDIGLSNGDYSYTVIALDAFDNASPASNTVTLTVSSAGPGLPQDLRVLAPPSGSLLELSWAPGGGATAVGFVLRRADAQTGPFVSIAQTPLLNWTDQPLINGRRYWYTVEALDAVGNASGQTAPVSGVPQDQQAPLPPTLGFPVHSGESVDFVAGSTMVSGVSEPGSRVDVRRSGVALAQASALQQDSVTELGNVYLFGRIMAAPSGTMLYGDGNRQVYAADDSGYIGESPYGSISGWTRDDRFVHRDNDNNWHSRAAAGGSDRPLPLALTNIENARFSSDLKYALVLGENPSNPTPGRAIWLVDRVQNSTRQVLGIDPSSVDFGSVDFAEFAGFAVWRSQSGELIHLRLSTARARSWASGLANARISLSLANGDALYVLDDAGVSVVHRVDPDGTTRIVGPGRVADWSADGAEFVIAEADGQLAIHRAADDMLVRRIALGGGEIFDLDWSMSGRLFVSTNSGTRVIDPAGSFRSTPIALLTGDNRLELFAVDSGGQGQPGGAAGIVRVAVGQLPLPDLSIRADDVLFVPSGGAPGQVHAAQLSIRNLGQSTSSVAAVRATLISPDGAQTLLPQPSPVPMLAAGSSAQVGLSLGQLNLAGTYWLNVELLVTGPDANPNNHSTSQRLVLLAGAQPQLELSANASNFAPGSDAMGQVRVRNPGSPWNGSVRMRILTASGEMLAELPGLPINGLAFGAELEQVWRWSTNNVLAASYRVQAELLDEQLRLLDTRTVAFSIDVVRDLRLDVVTERPDYISGDAVRINSTLDYLSGNAVVAGASLRTRVIDPAGVEVFGTTRALATLLPGYRIQIPATWTSLGNAGVYVVRAELVEAGSLTRLAQTSFSLTVPGAALAASGSIQPSPAPLIAGREGRIDFSLLNPAAATVVVDVLRLRLLRSADMSEAATQSIAGSVVAGGRLDGALILAESQLPIGAYLAVLDWRPNTGASFVPLMSRSVSVVDGLAPTISLRTPEADAWVRANATLAAAVTDSHSGVDRVELALDGGAWLPVPVLPQGWYGTDVRALADGSHQFQMRARDRAGNESISGLRNFQVDATAPVIEIAGVNDGDLLTQPATPVITIIEANPASSTISLNAAAFTSGTSISADGTYLLSVVARDLAGNVAARSLRFEIDTTVPLVMFVEPLDGAETTAASIPVRVQSEPQISVQLTAGAYGASAQSDASGIAEFLAVPLLFGANTLAANAVDRAGNTGPSATIQVTRIDNSGAALVGSLVPAASTVPSGQPAVLNWQVLNPGASPANNQTLRIRAEHVVSTQLLGDVPVVVDVPSGGQVAGATPFATAGAELGHYIATLSVVVGSETVQLASAEFDIVDTEPPQLAVLEPAAGALLNQPVRIRASASDSLGSVSSVRYQLDGAAPVAMTVVPGMPGMYESAVLDLADASYQLNASATDNAGNSSAAPMQAFTVDRTPPQITISGVADAVAYNSIVSPVVQVVDLHPGTTTVSLNGAPFVSGTSIADDGSYVLQVAAADAAGNVSDRTVTFQIDRTAPVIAFSFPAEGAIVATPVIDAGGLTEPWLRVEFMLGASSSVVFADSSGAFIVSGISLQEGSNVLQARAIDDVGNSSAWTTRTVIYQPNAGVSLMADVTLSTIDLPIGDPLTANYTISNTGSVAALDLPVRLLWIRVADQQQLSQHPFALNLAPGASVADAIALASGGSFPGAHLAVLEAFLTASDGSQSWQALGTAQAMVRDVMPPAVSLLAPDDGSYVDGVFSLRAQISDLHSAISSVEAVVGGVTQSMQASSVPGEYVATIKRAVEGPVLLSARAEDGAGNLGTSAQRTVVVDLLPPQIVISGADEAAWINQPPIITIVINDVSPVQSTITLDGQPFASGSTVSAEGAHLIRVMATDELGRTSEALRSFTIDTTPPLVQFSVPKDGAVIFAEATRVAGSSEPVTSIALRVGSYSQTLPTDGAGVFSVDDVPLVPGINQIAARATDRAGNVGPEAVITVERRGKPVVALQGNLELSATEWSNGTTLSTQFSLHNIGTADLLALPVRAQARRRDTQQILQTSAFVFDLAANAQLQQAIQWPTTDWGLGLVDIELIAELPARRAPILLDTHALNLVDRESPQLQFVVPSSGAALHVGDPVRVSASDRLSAIVQVQLRIDAGAWFDLGLIDLPTGSYGASLPSIAFGPHQLQARTADSAGNIATTSALPIAVVGVLPLALTAPLDGSSIEAPSVDFVGSSSAGALIRVSRSGLQWTAVADGTGAFTVPAVPLAVGDNRFSVRAEDAFGNASATINITVIGVGAADAIPIPLADRTTWWMLALLILLISSVQLRAARRAS